MTELQFAKSLSTLRKHIDEIDKKLIRQLAARAAVAAKIGKLKWQNKIPIVQKARWNDLIKNRLALASRLQLNVKTIDSIFKLIQKDSIAIQKNAIPKKANRK